MNQTRPGSCMPLEVLQRHAMSRVHTSWPFNGHQGVMTAHKCHQTCFALTQTVDVRHLALTNTGMIRCPLRYQQTWCFNRGFISWCERLSSVNRNGYGRPEPLDSHGMPRRTAALLEESAQLSLVVLRLPLRDGFWNERSLASEPPLKLSAPGNV